MNQVIFHLAFPIGNIPQTKQFYVDALGCKAGRESPNSIILNFYGNQLVGHITPEILARQQGIYPRHFGLVFAQLNDWQDFLERIKLHKLNFYQEPRIRFAGTPLEHHTFFLEDPFCNLLELKYYLHASAIFEQSDFSSVGDEVSS